MSNSSSQIKKNKDPEIVRKPKEIRNKMVEHFQDIFNKQDLNTKPDSIKDFLMEDDDIKPYEELLSRQLSEELKLELTLTELED